MDRKEFLQIVGRSALFAAASPALEAVAAGPPPSAVPVLGRAQRPALSALADEIIPAADGMPSASEMGATAYLEHVATIDEGIASSLRDALAALERRAQASRSEPFVRLSGPDRTSLLQALEKDEGELFRATRDLVYEAYYTNPLVWKRLGYDFIGGEDSGRPLEPFEEALLERVRALPRLYRAIP
jgi:hypothetical protein